jgi:lipopolysaccharide/colanic/teichoic acid biosynthesis glycosyltransferase
LATSAIGALKPLVHVDVIVAHLLDAVTEPPAPGFSVRRIADDQSRNPFFSIVVRSIDLILAILVLVLFWWLMLAIALLIRMQSQGPALFRQLRVGRRGQVFTCCKFRTMALDTPQVATHEVSADRTTSVGRWLRRWKLDELPQIFNVFANQMSWVGPRPSLPTQDVLIEERRRRGVLEVKPGITGLSQVRAIDMSDPVRLAQADEEAVFLSSIPLYFQVLLQTFLGRGMGDRIR